MLQGLSQFRIALLELLKQPHVLDGDDGLVGEGFEELDLRRGEGAHFNATCDHSSNECSMLAKGNAQKGVPAAEGAQRWEIVLNTNVGNVKRAVLAHPANL